MCTGVPDGAVVASSASRAASCCIQPSSSGAAERGEDIGPAIERSYASGKVGVIHVPIDPKVNSEEMPSYAEFRTWYAEGTQ
ncbi:MAG TPA: hypothetical protein VE197_12895 [Mycobacterium sp.]|nr:hypothetical protein [Mycobacterium sp.]